MKKVNVFLLLCLIMGGIAPSVNAARYNLYGGASAGIQSQRYEFKIRERVNGQTHNVDASNLSPEASLFGGWRTRFPNKFVLGLEAGATFFTSEIKRKINSSQTTYKVGRNFYCWQGAVVLGYFLRHLNAIAYLKLGLEQRPITIEVTAQGTNTILRETKNVVGFYPALGIELPLINQWSIGTEARFAFFQQLKFKSKDNTSDLLAEVSPHFDSITLRVIYNLGQR